MASNNGSIWSGVCWWVHRKAITSPKYNQYTEMSSIQAKENPRCGTRFGQNCKTLMPYSGWCMLLYEEQQVVDMLPPIPHMLWVHGQGLTSLGHIQYTRILAIKASEQPSCGTRFSETCNTTRPSSGLSILLHKEPDVMYMLPLIPHILWVHGKCIKSLKYNQYTEMLSIQATEHPICVNPRHRALNLWDQIWSELQNIDAILRLVYVDIWGTAGHEYVVTHST